MSILTQRPHLRRILSYLTGKYLSREVHSIDFDRIPGTAALAERWPALRSRHGTNFLSQIIANIQKNVLLLPRKFK